MTTWTTDINTDPSCSRVTNPDMALGSSSGQDITMAPVTSQVTHIVMAPVGRVTLRH